MLLKFIALSEATCEGINPALCQSSGVSHHRRVPRVLLCCGHIVLLRRLCPPSSCLQVVAVMAVQTAVAYAVKDVPC